LLRKSKREVKATVKVKVKTIKTEEPEEVEYAKTHAQIICTSSGGYELLLPTKLNEKLKDCVGKDFDIDVIEEGETLRVTTRQKKESPHEERQLK